MSPQASQSARRDDVKPSGSDYPLLTASRLPLAPLHALRDGSCLFLTALVLSPYTGAKPLLRFISFLSILWVWLTLRSTWAALRVNLKAVGPAFLTADFL